MKTTTTNQKTFDSLMDYTKNLSFGVRDFEKTFNKRNKYQPKNKNFSEADFTTMKIDHYNLIVGHSDVLNGMQYKYQSDKLETASNKSQIKEYKTCINSNVYKGIYNHIARYFDNLLTDSQIKGLTTRYYVNNYEEINDMMLEVLVDEIGASLEKRL